MRKSIFVVFLYLVCAFVFTSPASAIDGMYVSGNVGAVMLSDSDTSSDEIGSGDIGYDTGYAFTVAVGRKVEYIRVEGEFSYRDSDMEGASLSYSDASTTISATAGGDVKTFSFMLNTYFDIDTGTSFTPFIGGGIGVANVDVTIRGTVTTDEGGVVTTESASVGDDDTKFAYQAIAGVAFAMSDNISLDLSYRYFATADLEFDGDVKSEYGGHNLMIGFRYSF